MADMKEFTWRHLEIAYFFRDLEPGSISMSRRQQLGKAIHRAVESYFSLDFFKKCERGGLLGYYEDPFHLGEEEIKKIIKHWLDVGTRRKGPKNTPVIELQCGPVLGFVPFNDDGTVKDKIVISEAAEINPDPSPRSKPTGRRCTPQAGEWFNRDTFRLQYKRQNGEWKDWDIEVKIGKKTTNPATVKVPMIVTLDWKCPIP